MSIGASGRSARQLCAIRPGAAAAAMTGLLLVFPAVFVIAAAPLSSPVLSGSAAAVHVLDRLAFGPTLEELRRIKTIGEERYISEQLDPDQIPEPIELRWRV